MPPLPYEPPPPFDPNLYPNLATLFNTVTPTASRPTGTITEETPRGRIGFDEQELIAQGGKAVAPGVVQMPNGVKYVQQADGKYQVGDYSPDAAPKGPAAPTQAQTIAATKEQDRPKGPPAGALVLVDDRLWASQASNRQWYITERKPDGTFDIAAAPKGFKPPTGATPDAAAASLRSLGQQVEKLPAESTTRRITIPDVRGAKADLEVSNEYNPRTVFQEGPAAFTSKMRDGTDQDIISTGYQTAEARNIGGSGAGLGFNSNVVLQGHGARPTGDPFKDQELAFQLLQQDFAARAAERSQAAAGVAPTGTRQADVAPRGTGYSGSDYINRNVSSPSNLGQGMQTNTSGIPMTNYYGERVVEAFPSTVVDAAAGRILPGGTNASQLYSASPEAYSPESHFFPGWAGGLERDYADTLAEIAAGVRAAGGEDYSMGNVGSWEEAHGMPTYAARGASKTMDDPFAVVNLRTQRPEIIGSEYGQRERVSVSPMGGNSPVNLGGDTPVNLGPGGDYPVNLGGDTPVRLGGDYPVNLGRGGMNNNPRFGLDNRELGSGDPTANGPMGWVQPRAPAPVPVEPEPPPYIDPFNPFATQPPAAPTSTPPVPGVEPPVAAPVADPTAPPPVAPAGIDPISQMIALQANDRRLRMYDDSLRARSGLNQSIGVYSPDALTGLGPGMYWQGPDYATPGAQAMAQMQLLGNTEDPFALQTQLKDINSALQLGGRDLGGRRVNPGNQPTSVAVSAPVGWNRNLGQMPPSNKTVNYSVGEPKYEPNLVPFSDDEMKALLQQQRDLTQKLQDANQKIDLQLKIDKYRSMVQVQLDQRKKPAA